MSLTAPFYAGYKVIQEAHYMLAERSVLYRVLSLTIFAIFAPLILLTLWAPAILELYVRELVAFYIYLPDGFRGCRRAEDIEVIDNG